MPRISFHIVWAGALALSGVGCGKGKLGNGVAEEKVKPSAELPASAPNKVPPKRVSNRPSNPNGSVFIAEYHHIRDGKSTMERSPALMRRDLERLYKLGFRPINITEYLSGDFNLPPGASPVILTFDDAHPTQVALRADGTLDPNSGLGILKEFSDKHPDFPPKAVFFVLPQLWGQSDQAAKKAELIKSWGGEIANHTITHPNLAKLNDEKVKEELAGSFKLLEPLQGNAEYLALPLGVSPKNKALLKSFNHQGKDYQMKAVFLVGANPAPPPSSDKFNPTRIPRIQACEGDYGLDYWLDLLEKGQVKPFVAP